MSTQTSLAGLETFDKLHYDYELAYEDNPFKKACISAAIGMLPPSARVLDVGCGTGVPVSDMLATAGFEVHGCDISPKMVQLARERVRGTFEVADMLNFAIPGKFSAIFFIFSHLQFSYLDFHTACSKYARSLEPNGLFVIGQMPADKYVIDDPASYGDPTQTWAEDYDAPFMGELLPTFMMSADGQREFLKSMGLEIVWERIDEFQPKNEICVPEEQQYIIAKRVEGRELVASRPLPRKRLEVSSSEVGESSK